MVGGPELLELGSLQDDTSPLPGLQSTLALLALFLFIYLFIYFLKL